MIGNCTVLPERNPENVEPLGWKVIVEVEKEKQKGLVVKPDSAKAGDTTRQGFWATIHKRGSKVELLEDDAFKPGVRVVIDPSIDMMNPARAFTWEGRHYVLCDSTDILAIG